MERGMILVGKPEGKGNSKDTDVGGCIILKWILVIGWSGMGWIDLGRDMAQ
jgi:hypothetical protein